MQSRVIHSLFSAVVLITAPLPLLARGYQNLDWVEYDLLNEEQKSEVSYYCPGTFVDPLGAYASSYSIQDQNQYPVNIKAEQLEQLADERIEAIGRVSLQRNLIQMQADHMVYDRANQFGLLEGDVKIRQPDFLVVGNSAETNLDSGEYWLQKGEFVIHSDAMIGLTSDIYGAPNGHVHLTRTQMTKCDPHHPVWKLKASKVTLKPEKGIATSRHTRLHIKKVPVMYLPYFRFPIDDQRHTGFLNPTFETEMNLFDPNEESDDRIKMVTPFYWNIAPFMDDTITPHVQGDSLYLLDNEFRYMSRKGNGQFLGSWTEYEIDPDTDPQWDEQRWWYQIDHTQRLSSQWTLKLNAASASDQAFEEDFKGDDEDNDYYSQSLKLTHKQGRWNNTTTVQRYAIADENLSARSTPYARQPAHRITGSIGGSPFTPGLSVDSEAARFARNLSESELDTIAPTDVKASEGGRWHTKLGFSYPLEWPFAYIRPKVNLLHTQYQLDRTSDNIESSPERTMYQYSLETGLIFERDIPELEGWTQTLEPKIFYTRTPFEEQSELPLFDTSATDFSQSMLYRSERFSGSDRVGDMERVTTGVSTTINNQRNEQVLKVSADQLFYLTPERTALTSTLEPETEEIERSLFFTSVDWKLTTDWTLGMRHQWDWETDALEKENYFARYRSSSRQIFNLDWLRTGQETELEESASTSFIYPIAQRWGLIGIYEWQQEYFAPGKYNANSEAWGGFEFDSCCWNFRMLLSREESEEFRRVDGEIQRDHEVERTKVLWQITLKGLGSPGSGLDNLLTERIDGYSGRIYQ